MLWRPFAAILAALAPVALAQAAGEPSLQSFSGQWIGKVTVETMGPTDFPNTVRESGVTITPDDKGGFTLEWSTVRRDSGDPSNPDETAQDVEIAFPKGTAPNRWAAEAKPSDDGATRWFARLDDSTLTVTGFALLEDGQAELQTYRRTLEGDAMALTYTRVVDGDIKRRASGALTRFAQ